MKTTPLSQVLTQIAPLPWEVEVETGSVWAENESHPTAICSHAAIDREYKAKPKQLANAAYLAHAANQHAKLVATLTELLEVAEDLKASVNNAEGFSGPPTIFAAAREVLRAANEVQIPD